MIVANIDNCKHIATAGHWKQWKLKFEIGKLKNEN